MVKWFPEGRRLQRERMDEDLRRWSELLTIQDPATFWAKYADYLEWLESRGDRMSKRREKLHTMALQTAERLNREE